MKNKLDVSWKDFLAGLVCLLTTGIIFRLLMMGAYLFAQYFSLKPEVYLNYITPLSCVAALVGGMVLGKIRPHVAVRNVFVPVLIVILFGTWLMNDLGANSLEIFKMLTPPVGGMLLGAWFIQRQYLKKEKLV